MWVPLLTVVNSAGVAPLTYFLWGLAPAVAGRPPPAPGQEVAGSQPLTSVEAARSCWASNSASRAVSASRTRR